MLYKREGSTKWWYSFTRNGHRYQGSTKLENRKAAEDYEAGRIVQIAKREVGLADRPRYTVGEVLDRLKLRWQLKGKASVQNLSLLKKAKEDWGTKMADEITTQHLETYALRRQKEKYANATTNRIFQCLRRAFTLAGVPWPEFELLNEKDNVRQGFFKPEEMEKVLANLPDDGLRDFVFFCWVTGMRKGEGNALRWSFVHGDNIIVPAGFCKNKKPHRIPIAGPLSAIIERRKTARAFKSYDTTQFCEFIFHRNGEPIREFRKSWRTACKKAECPGRIFHDLRRTACSDMIDAGVPQSVCMAISGHTTISTFLRYAISSDDAKSEALEKTEKYRAG